MLPKKNNVGIKSTIAKDNEKSFGTTYLSTLKLYNVI